MHIIKNQDDAKTVTIPRLSYGFKEAAIATGLSDAYLRKEARLGKIKVKEFGTRKIILAEDLMTYLKGENQNV